MEQTATPLRYQAELCNRPLTTEITQELSLPDYQPEIKRLLRVSATAQPPSRYLGGGSAEFTGAVDFTILYATADGSVYCYPTSADYSFRVPMEAGSTFDLADDMSCYCLCEPDMTGGRVLGPRRMSVRCRLRAHIRAYATTIVDQVFDNEPKQPPERLLREVTTATVRSGSSAPLTLTDEILPTSDASGDDWRIISATAAVLPEEITAVANTILCRGQAVVRLLMQRDSTPAATPTQLLRKLPFNTEIPVDGITAAAEANVSGCCTELRLTVEDNRVLCEAELLLSAQTQEEQTLPYVADINCIGQKTECTTATQTALAPIRCINANFTQSESIPLEQAGIGTGTTILDVSGFVVPDSVTLSCERGHCVVSGKCRYSLILGGEDVSAKELDLPFRYTCDLPAKAAAHALHDYDCRLHVITVRPRTDGQSLSLDTELYITARLWGKNEFAPVIATALSACHTEQGLACRIVCYPAHGETLWSIAKRYCVGVDTLAQKNSLPSAPRADSPDSLRGVHMLVI